MTEWLPSTKPESVALQVPEVFAPPEVSVQTALAHVVPPSSEYWIIATPEAPALGSVAVPDMVYAVAEIQEGIAFSAIVGGVVSMLTVRFDRRGLPRDVRGRQHVRIGAVRLTAPPNGRDRDV